MMATSSQPHARTSPALENILWLACCQIHQPLAEKKRAHAFQIISPPISQTPLNYSRCAMQGVIMTIRKMVTLGHAHLPSILTSCICSLLSCCSLSTAGAVSPTASAADKQPGLVGCGWKGTYFSLPTPPPLFFFKYFSKRKKRRKQKDDLALCTDQKYLTFRTT